MNAILTGPLALASRRLHCWRYISAVALHNNNLMPSRRQQNQNNNHNLQITRHMAGHNKWSKIKRKKAANDVARARDHTKAARAIEVASRSCQGDMADISLQSALAAARAVQLPKERIEKAIERGANPNAKDELSVIRRYDGMVPGSNGKVAVIIETLTENKNRTAANVRHLVTKIGGELLPTGANDWLFEHVGVVCVSRNKHTNEEENATGEPVDEDELLECALDGGATDVDFGADEDQDTSNAEVDSIDNPIVIKCETSGLLRLVQSLKTDGYVSSQFDNQWLVRSDDNKVILNEEGSDKFEKFLDSMDEDLDVTNVYHNATFPEEVS
mmetsp:Transcript_13319/g.27003  ORF Transcript_13319/g.27003 Transcript_13319/m.27003 type:complete len:330 (-) Transcript_13319:88-1077(-)